MSTTPRNALSSIENYSPNVSPEKPKVKTRSKGLPLLVPDSPLHFAIRTGDKTSTENEIQKVDSLAAINEDGQTAFHLATEMGDLPLVKKILDELTEEEQQAVLHQPVSMTGDTPLHIAARKGGLEIVQFLLEKGVSRYLRNEFGYTPLHLALIYRQEAIVAELFRDLDPSKQALLLTMKAKDALHPFVAIQFAMKSCSSKIVRYLLSLGANSSVKTEDGKTLLHLAALRSHKVFSQLLLQDLSPQEMIERIEATDTHGNTPLMTAINERNQVVCDFYLTSFARYYFLDLDNEYQNVVTTRIYLAMIRQDLDTTQFDKISQLSSQFAKQQRLEQARDEGEAEEFKVVETSNVYFRKRERSCAEFFARPEMTSPPKKSHTEMDELIDQFKGLELN